jgi:hypothetical protein
MPVVDGSGTVGVNARQKPDGFLGTEFEYANRFRCQANHISTETDVGTVSPAAPKQQAGESHEDFAAALI